MAEFTRRTLLKGAAALGAAAMLGGCAPQTLEEDELSQTGGDAAEETGTWLTGACMNNCSCGSSRCLLKVYVEDGVQLKIRTDEEDEDSIEVPQRRACPRGRAQIGHMMSPARIK